MTVVSMMELSNSAVMTVKLGCTFAQMLQVCMLPCVAEELVIRLGVIMSTLGTSKRT